MEKTNEEEMNMNKENAGFMKYRTEKKKRKNFSHQREKECTTTGEGEDKIK